LRILFLSDNFPPEVNAPASRTFEHCLEWVRAGHEVTVITCAPNFPAGRVFKGYRNRLRQVEMHNGIRIVRVWSFVSANEGFALRVIDYMSYMVSATVAALFERRPDVVAGTSPQFFAACAAWMVAAIKRRPFVFELRDLWPESIKAVGAMRDSPAIRLLERIEMFLYRRARLIVSVTHGFKDTLTRRGIDPRKITIVTNGADLSRFRPRPPDPALRRQLGLGDDDFVIGYIGTHGMAHGLSTLLAAAAQLQDHPLGRRCHFIFLGDGAEKKKLVEQARSLGLRNVRFLDSVTKDEVVRFWTLLNVSVMHLLRNELFSVVIPSKLFESMAMGVPVLSSVPGETQRLIETNRVGIPFKAEDPDDLVRAILQLLEHPDELAALRQQCIAAAPKFDRHRLAQDMLAQLANCAHED